MTHSDERLVYQITVTAPGTKSQGWHGVLLDIHGKPMTVEPGKTVHTHFGTFVSVAESTPWTPYGMIHEDTVQWMQTHGGNVIMDSEPWAYRLYVEREGSKSEGWRGELLHGRGIVPEPSDEKPFATPMGPFTWVRPVHLWDRAGWLHVSVVEGKKAA